VLSIWLLALSDTSHGLDLGVCRGTRCPLCQAVV